ncbi:winged helix-turn-helix transcriptional regulator [Actinophytocola oryzae]|uniref:HxlR family transcriptional regulator n=1 Tax=Actinophytocola oryzae TaxID=502181 RepID=A0A4R7W1R4_9PSEU|nr:helix-turn-helix domain-containing protein [Actinophytocola oryzae]TDV56055.1 HxlR family transcriptional regulator [Actinophytocola oryzae]
MNERFGSRQGAATDERVRAVFSLLSSWRTASAIGSLESGPKRFGALLREMDGVSPKVLTRTLRRLEGFGMVRRQVYPAVPAHVEYSLTKLGESVAAPLLELRFWVETNTGSLGGDGSEER